MERLFEEEFRPQTSLATNTDLSENNPREIQIIEENLPFERSVIASNSVSENISINSSESTDELSQHLNDSILCEILKQQKFSRLEGPSLKEKLRPNHVKDKFGKILKELRCLLGKYIFSCASNYGIFCFT